MMSGWSSVHRSSNSGSRARRATNRLNSVLSSCLSRRLSSQWPLNRPDHLDTTCGAYIVAGPSRRGSRQMDKVVHFEIPFDDKQRAMIQNVTRSPSCSVRGLNAAMIRLNVAPLVRKKFVTAFELVTL